MSNAISQFNFVSHAIRVVLDDRGEPWFLANDVCAILGYTNPSKTVADHCKAPGVTKRYMGVVTGKKSNGEDAVQEVEMTYINESNLYRLIIKSRKPEAEKFETFVMEEVLPTIRKTGRFELATHKVATINHKQYYELSQVISRTMVGWCFDQGDRERIMNNIRLTFNVQSLKDLPADQFEAAMALAQKTKEMSNACLIAMNEFKEAMIREVVMGGAPHTSVIVRKYKQKFGAMPKQINWVEMAKALEML